MKVYLASGIYYEMQADARKADRGFETVEFPFAASPKADFVAWLNGPGRAAEMASGMTADQALAPSPLLDEIEWKPVPQPQPTQPVQTDAAKFANEVNERWGDLPLGLRVDLGLSAFEELRSRKVAP